jgi:tripartite ATP-independent transporter DctM subunit
VILVIYGLLTERSIGKLFFAALIPGLLGTLLYMAAVTVRIRLNPELAPSSQRLNPSERCHAIQAMWPVGLLFALVMGGIYIGWFSPTEAAAIGASGTLLYAIFKRTLQLPEFISCLTETANTTGMIFLILVGTAMFNFFIESSGLPQFLVAGAQELAWNPYWILLLIILFYLVLGCFMDSLSMLLLTVPLVFPLILDLGFDPIWFGVIIVTVVEIGLITPPIGMNLFTIMGSTPDLKLPTLVRGVVPFLLADIVRLAILIAIPGLVLWLPGQML